MLLYLEVLLGFSWDVTLHIIYGGVEGQWEVRPGGIYHGWRSNVNSLWTTALATGKMIMMRASSFILLSSIAWICPTEALLQSVVDAP